MGALVAGRLGARAVLPGDRDERGVAPRSPPGTWLFHFTISFGFIALIPHTYFVHLITTPLNTFLVKLTPRGELKPILNIEEAESLGVSKLEEFSWKRRLDFDACTMCGRCQDVCPAFLAGTPLSPKQIILKLRGLMREGNGRAIHGETIAAEELWACTTCMACVEACPAFIDIVDTIVDLRRYLALSEGALPGTAGMSLQNMQRAGQPLGTRRRGPPRLGRGARRAADPGGTGGRVPLLGRMLGLLRSTEPEHRPSGGEGAPGGGRLLRGHARRAVQRRRRTAARRGVPLPDARQRERREPEALPLPEGARRLSPLLQHHRQRVPAVRRRVRGRSSLRPDRPAGPRGPAPAHPAARGAARLPRLLLHRPLQRASTTRRGRASARSRASR